MSPSCSTRNRAGDLDRRNRDEQERLRQQHAARQRRPLLPLPQARENRERVGFDDLPVPEFTGTRVVAPDLPSLRELIDWQFFFSAWELKGKFPKILDVTPPANSTMMRWPCWMRSRRAGC